MTESEAPVLTQIKGSIGVVTLNRPRKSNCISSEVMSGLREAFEQFEADRSVRAVVLKANGKHFCTGADLDQVLEARRSQDDLRYFIASGHDTLQKMERSRLPVVAVVQGLCLAGGLEIVMACDVVFAGRSARFGCQHAQYGLLPGWGGTQRLPRLVGLRRALDLMLSARWLDAAEAREWQLVNHVVDDAELEHQAMTYAAMLGTRNPEGLAHMKALAREGLDRTLAAGLEEEQATALKALRSESVTEGLAAFQARRQPVFT